MVRLMLLGRLGTLVILGTLEKPVRGAQDTNLTAISQSDGSGLVPDTKYHIF